MHNKHTFSSFTFVLFSCCVIVNGLFYSLACLVACPWNESEAGGDLVMIETSLLFLF